MREKALEMQRQALPVGEPTLSPRSPTPSAYTTSPFKRQFSSPTKRTPVNFKSVARWTETEVYAWMSVLPDGLDRYKDLFRANNVTGKV